MATAYITWEWWRPCWPPRCRQWWRRRPCWRGRRACWRRPPSPPQWERLGHPAFRPHLGGRVEEGGARAGRIESRQHPWAPRQQQRPRLVVVVVLLLPGVLLLLGVVPRRRRRRRRRRRARRLLRLLALALLLRRLLHPGQGARGHRAGSGVAVCVMECVEWFRVSRVM